MDWGRILNTAANFFIQVGRAVSSVGEEMAKEITRNYLEIMIYSVEGNEGRSEFLQNQIRNGQILSVIEPEYRMQLFNESCEAVAEKTAPNLSQCCQNIKTMHELSMLCWAETVTLFCSNNGLSAGDLSWIAFLAGQLELNIDDTFIKEYIASIQNRFLSTQKFFHLYWEKNAKKLPKEPSKEVIFIERMVNVFGIQPLDPNLIQAVPLRSITFMRFVSFLFGIFGLDWLILGCKGRAFFKLLFTVVMGLIICGVISLSPTLHTWILRIGIPLWIIIWIKDFAVSIPKQTREYNLKKACEELSKAIFE